MGPPAKRNRYRWRYRQAWRDASRRVPVQRQSHALHSDFGVDVAKIHILVLDRNSRSAQSIGQILKSVGCQVSVTSHQADAIALVEEELFNVVVKAFDPDAVDAIALMDRIRAITPDTQFIFISEKGSIQVAVNAIRKGA